MIPLVWFQRMMVSTCFYTSGCHCSAAKIHTSYSHVSASQGSNDDGKKAQQSLEESVLVQKTFQEEQNITCDRRNDNEHYEMQEHLNGKKLTHTSSEEIVLMHRDNDKVQDTSCTDIKDGLKCESLGKDQIERNIKLQGDMERMKEDSVTDIHMCRTDEGEEVNTVDNPVLRQNILVKDNSATPPTPPTTCCMSGCHNCVWIEYADCLAEHYRDGGVEACRMIEKEIEDPSLRAFILMEVRLKGLKN